MHETTIRSTCTSPGSLYLPLCLPRGWPREPHGAVCTADLRFYGGAHQLISLSGTGSFHGVDSQSRPFAIIPQAVHNQPWSAVGRSLPLHYIWVWGYLVCCSHSYDSISYILDYHNQGENVKHPTATDLRDELPPKQLKRSYVGNLHT